VIAVKFILSPIQNILFCKIEAVIRLSVLKKTSFGNQLFCVVNKLITTAILTIKIWRFVYD